MPTHRSSPPPSDRLFSFGPFAPDMFEARETQDDPQIETWLVEELTDDLRANRRALARKALLFNTALRLLLFAIAAGLAGRL